jgi:hypothetical protein
MVRLIYTFFSLAFIALILYSCANIKQPTGGPEDKKPPVLVKSTPENNSVNFKGKTVTLQFDEYVDAQKLREEIIISPIEDGNFDLITKKKTVSIRFRKDLKENTTYSISFGESSIKDVTKGNFVRDLFLAFSTGPVIDSLSLSGFVYDFISEKGIKDISIQLYNANDTNNIFNSKPVYFHETNAGGNFTIRNIKEGVYNIYALQDINQDYKYNVNKEYIAYLYNIPLSKKLTTVKLGLTKPDYKAPEITSFKQENDYLLLSSSKGLENYKINADTGKVLSELLIDSKKIKVFNNFKTKDSINLYLQLTDSSNNTGLDTVKVAFEQFTDKNKKNTFNLKYGQKKLEILKNEYINIIFNKPVNKIDYSFINIKTDSISIPIKESDFKLDSTLLKLTIKNTFTFKDSLVLKFEKGAFTSISGDSNLYNKLKLVHKNEELYGIVAGTVKCNEPNYIFQLLDDKGKVVDSKKNIKVFNYKYLEPGDYRLKIIIDKNNNGRWDPTDIENDIAPETIKYYKDIINLRANWEVLDINFEVK